MYLVARPEAQARDLIQLLATNGVAAKYLPLMATEIKPVNLATALAQINSCDGVFFSSPLAIDYVAKDLSTIKPSCRIFSAGASSAKRLLDLGVACVNYPAGGSGISALISAKLLLKYSLHSLAIVGGDQVNPQLASYLNYEKITFKFIDLYQRSNLGLANLNLFAKLINESSIVGIIITSTLLARYLSDCCRKLNLGARLAQLALLSLHPQITQYLTQQGFSKVYETATADNRAILTLIRKLHDERKN